MEEVLNENKKNFINELITIQKEKNNNFKTTHQYRDSILFEQSLSRDQIINIYDCHG